MFVDNAYWRNSRIDFKDRKHPLFVGSCGTYRLLTLTKLPTHRPRGRVDFQLLYVAAGKGHFYFNGKEHIVPAGNMVLYRPREEQRYYYYGADHTEVYWVHFTGNNVTNILRQYGFKDGEHIVHSGTSLEYSHIFQQMISELKECRPHFENACIYRLHLLFILLSRLGEKKVRRKTPHMAGQMHAPGPGTERELVYTELPRVHGNLSRTVSDLPAYFCRPEPSRENGPQCDGDCRAGRLRQSPLFQSSLSQADRHVTLRFPQTASGLE